ncbi:hypothetical protein CO676_33230 [Sinorhizobium sp. BJ1]|nr:hypothetical protein CO676_33230 [Sinorhizobium sp. BJ1]
MSIFFAKPCGTSKKISIEAALLAKRDLQSHRKDDDWPVARRIQHRSNVLAAGVSRASYYRRWLDSAPRRAESGLRDLIQKVALGNAHYGYRRIGALLRREGWQVNHKCILRIMREDNLLCLRARSFVPTTTNSRHGWQVVPNLARA